eukprot:EC720774.1.p1 GENE.EC720774.1~~EC720774.1.p1  ORF type:complete len:87 (+),score=3.50 EC720774.1:49-309(+)
MATVDADLPPCRIPAIPFAFDYGGTLIKVAFYLPEDRAPESGQFSQVIHRPHIGLCIIDGYLCCEKFPASQPQECIDFLKKVATCT